MHALNARSAHETWRRTSHVGQVLCAAGGAGGEARHLAALAGGIVCELGDAKTELVERAERVVSAQARAAGVLCVLCAGGGEEGEVAAEEVGEHGRGLARCADEAVGVERPVRCRLEEGERAMVHRAGCV
jgi:hypothetical protein